MCLLYIHIGMQLFWPLPSGIFLEFQFDLCDLFVFGDSDHTSVRYYVDRKPHTKRRLREYEVSNRKPHCLALARFLRDFLGLKNVFLISVATRESQ